MSALRLLWLPLLAVTAFLAHVEFSEPGSVITLNVARSAQAEEATAAEIETALKDLKVLRQKERANPDTVMNLAQEVHDKILAAEAMRASGEYLKVACELDIIMSNIASGDGKFASTDARDAGIKHAKHCLEHAQEAGSIAAPWESVILAHISLASSYNSLSQLNDKVAAELAGLESLKGFLSKDLAEQDAYENSNYVVRHIGEQIRRVFLGGSKLWSPYYLKRVVEARQSVTVDGLIEFIESSAHTEEMPSQNKHIAFAAIFRALDYTAMPEYETSSPDQEKLRLRAATARALAIEWIILKRGPPDWEQLKPYLVGLIPTQVLAARELGLEKEAKLLERVMIKIRDI
jgi:hypothetical protein